MSKYNEITINKTYEGINGLGVETRQETHAKAIIGLEDVIKKVVANQSSEVLEPRATTVPIVQLQDGGEKVFVKSHIEAIDGLEDGMPTQPDGSPKVEGTSGNVISFFNGIGKGLSTFEIPSVANMSGMPGGVTEGSAIGTVNKLKSNQGTVTLQAIANGLPKTFFRNLGFDFNLWETPVSNIFTGNFRTPSDRFSTYPPGLSYFSVTSGSGFPHEAGSILTMMHDSWRTVQFNFGSSGEISFRVWADGNDGTSWRPWRRVSDTTGHVNWLNGDDSKVTAWNNMGTVFNKVPAGGGGFLWSDTTGTNGINGAVSQHCFLMKWGSNQGMLIGYPVSSSTRSLAIRHYVQGNWQPWLNVPTTTSFQAPINKQTGEEMDVYECHYYLEETIERQTREIELQAKEIKQMRLFQEFALQKLGISSQEFQEFAKTKELEKEVIEEVTEGKVEVNE